jgi:hypothetical protein
MEIAILAGHRFPLFIARLYSSLRGPQGLFLNFALPKNFVFYKFSASWQLRLNFELSSMGSFSARHTLGAAALMVLAFLCMTPTDATETGRKAMVILALGSGSCPEKRVSLNGKLKVWVLM